MSVFTNIFKCFFKTCCKCVKCICCSICEFIYKYLVVAACSCVIGMATMAFIMLLYYGIFYPAQRTATLEHTGMYDYDQSKIKGHNYQKKNLITSDSEEYNQGDYYYDTGIVKDEGDNDILRIKRNLSASSIDVSSSAVLTTPPSITTVNIAILEVTASSAEISTTTTTFTATKAERGNITTHKSMFGQPSHSTTTQSADEYDPDFHLGNAVMDAVFSHAEASDMKQTLGLCRKNADLKVPQFKASLFPGEQAADILNCINDLLRNQTKKQICLQLDAEMSAYLKWLVLTGESKERHKPVKIPSKEDFLFPSSCAPDQSAVTPECLVEPVVRENFEE